MAQIPMTPGRSRMPGTPNLKIGTGTVTPDDLGSRQYNEYSRLARAIGGAAQAHGQWAQRKYNERAEAEMLTGRASYMEEYAKEEERVRSTMTGGNAIYAPQAMAEFAKKRSEEISGTLSTPLAKEMFARSILDFDRQNSVAMDSFALNQDKIHRDTGLEGNIHQEMNNAAANAMKGIGIAGNIQIIKGYNAQLYQGMAPEFIDMKNQQMTSLAVEKVADVLANSKSPQAALDFLDSGIEAEIGDENLKIKFDALRKKYEEAGESAQIASDAIRMVDTGMASAEAFKYAWDTWPEDKAKREQFLTNYDNYQRRKVQTEQAAKVAEDDAGWQELAKVGFDATRLPVSIRNENPKLFQDLTNYSAWLNQTGNAKLDPDLAWIDEKTAMLPSELRSYLANNGYGELMRKAGGNMAYVNEVRKRSQMADEESRQKSGGGTGGGSSKFDDGLWFEDAYASIYPTKIYGTNTYLDGGNEAKRRKNGFMLRFDERVRAGDGVWKGEEKEGRKPGGEELQAIAMRLTADAIQGRVSFDSTFYDEIKAREAGRRDVPVAHPELTPEQQTRFRSMPVISRENENGQASRFAVLDVNTDDPRTGIFVDVKNAMYPPTEALIAMDRGTLNRHGQALAYEADWHIVTFENGDINTYDRSWNFKGQIVPSAPARPGAAPADAQAFPEPRKPQRIMELEKKGYRFTWQAEAGFWTGISPDGVQKTYTATSEKPRGAARSTGLSGDELEEMRKAYAEGTE